MRIKARVIAMIGALIMLTPSTPSTALAAPSQLSQLTGKQAIVVQTRSAKSSSADGYVVMKNQAMYGSR